MLYDRPYMRQPQAPHPAQRMPVVTLLLIITICVFVLQQLFNVFFPNPYLPGNENAFMAQWFALSGENFRALKIWTLLSYSFLHSTQSLMHLIGNMLGLFFIGRILEPILGRHKFLLLYFSGAVCGGLLYLLLHFSGSTVVVGASAAVFALLTVFCQIHPERPITLLLFFILPVTVKPRYVFWASLAISALGLLFYELSGRSHLAHSAHLGGILLGLVFYRTVYLPGSIFSTFGSGKSHIRPPEWLKRHAKKGAEKLDYSVNRSRRSDRQKEVDRILDKINTSGFGSLSEAEKSTLERAKDLFNS
jgi:membrane associated rhomboid family serine protease